jgi:hypothetical protein
MRLIRILFFILFSISFFTFCGGKNKSEKKSISASADIISSTEMAGVLEDIYLAEGAVNSKELYGNNPGYFACRYYNYVLAKHNLTAEEFMKSYTFYSADAEEMILILDMIITDLSEKQGLLQGSTNPE